MIRKSIIILIIIILLIFTSSCSNKSFIIDISSIKNTETIETYYGYLKIPKINMKLGFFTQNSKLNDVNKNIELIETNIIDTYLIAGHSGSGNLAYFNDLRYLNIGDELMLEFKDKTKKYIVKNVRKEIKDGNISIKKESGWLILTTCDQIDKGYQLIIEGKLV